VSATERGDLAERLLPIAAGLACVVHGDGDHRDVAHILAELDQAERDALIVVLAGLVDPNTTVVAALGYLTWDEHGRAAKPADRQETLRDVAVHRAAPSGVRELLIEEQKLTARIRYHHLGDHQKDIARDLQVHERTVSRWVHAPEAAA
jgi:ActR/RegA family two-component response regulator